VGATVIIWFVIKVVKIILITIFTILKQSIFILTTALFWVITRRVVVNPCRRFGTTYLFHLQGSRIKQILAGFLNLEYGTNRRSRNFGKELLLLAA